MKFSRDGIPLSTAAAKAGMDEKTARNTQSKDEPTSERNEEAAELAHAHRSVRGRVARDRRPAASSARIRSERLKLLEDLQRRRDGEFQDGQLRTLQRRIRAWRGLQGPDAGVFFPQVQSRSQRA